MADKVKIGQRDATGLSKGHANKSQASDTELWKKMREFQEAVAAKLNADSGVNDTDYDTLINIED